MKPDYFSLFKESFDKNGLKVQFVKIARSVDYKTPDDIIYSENALSVIVDEKKQGEKYEEISKVVEEIIPIYYNPYSKNIELKELTCKLYSIFHNLNGSQLTKRKIPFILIQRDGFHK